MSTADWTPPTEEGARRERVIFAFDRVCADLEELTRALADVLELRDPHHRLFSGCATASAAGRAVRAAVGVMLGTTSVVERRT